MRYNHFSMLPERAFQPRGRYGMTLEGGDGGGGQPANTTQVTIPEYAKPYMERLLGKTEALTSKGYQTYGGERLSSPTDEQLAARQGVAELQTPGEYGAGSNLAGLGGLSSLTAGQQYAGMVTDPSQVGSYMSPYMQNVSDIAKRQAAEDARKVQMASSLSSSRQGTYGGSRQLLGQLEREKALGQTMADIDVKGRQSAYEQAIKNMQFGTQAGLQGAQQAAQAGQTLGQLGTARQGSDLQRLQAQEAAGALGQRESQAKLDMAYQDFLTQQQYPYKQLGFMSDLLRGSANLAGTGGKTVYEQPASLGSQLLGLGATLGGSYLAGGGKFFAEGGEVKGLSGIKGYAGGGDVFRDMITTDKLTPEQIKGIQKSGTNSEVPNYVLLGELEEKLAEINRLQANMQKPSTNVEQDIRQEAMQVAGLEAIPVPDDYYRSEEETAQLAGGGIVAFANGGSIPINERYGGRQYPDGSVGFAGPLAFIGPALTAGRAALGRDPLIAGGRAIATGAKNLGKGLFTRAPLTTLGTLGGLGYGAFDYVTSEGEPGSSEAAAFADRQDKEAGAALAQQAKNKKVEVSDKTVKKIAKAEDAYEKSLREELDKTNMSEDDKLRAIGYGMIKAGEKISEGKKGRGIEAFTKGVSAAADEYVKTLNQSKKDKRELTKTFAEYGLAKEKLGIMREEVAAKREGTAETAATRKEIAMQNLLSKANAEYNDLLSKNPLMGQRFLDKENKKINPQFKSRTDYLREQMQMAINPSNLMDGASASSMATPGQRPALSSFRG
jgi:hypothetical protein